MTSSEFRAEARKKLQGKWGKGVVIILCFILISFIISIILSIIPKKLELISSIAELIIEIPLGFGFVFAFFKLYNGEETKGFDFLTLAVENFSRSWGVTLRMLLKMILPIVLLIISYIILGVGVASMGFISVIGAILVVASYIWLITKSYYYQLAYFIAMENPNLSPIDCVQKSEDLMQGNRAKLFFLQLSFIGWAILSIFSFGIGLLWLIPYTYFAEIAFYKYLSEKKDRDIEIQTQTETNSTPEIENNDDNPIQKL